jgi:hypothetical protein
VLLQVFFGDVEQRAESGPLPAVSGTGSSCSSG